VSKKQNNYLSNKTVSSFSWFFQPQIFLCFLSDESVSTDFEWSSYSYSFHENCSEQPSQKDSFRKSFSSEFHQLEDNLDDEHQIELLIQENRVEQKKLEKELANLIRDFKEYCLKSNEIITDDNAKIDVLDDMVDQNITKVKKETVSLTSLRGGGDWSFWSYFTDYIRLLLFLGSIGDAFVLTFALILFKNKRSWKKAKWFIWKYTRSHFESISNKNSAAETRKPKEISWKYKHIMPLKDILISTTHNNGSRNSVEHRPC